MTSAEREIKKQKINEPLLRKTIREYCFERLESKTFPEDLQDDTDMFKVGIIDSIDALELLIGFEDDFGMTVPEELQDVSDLGSISGLSAFVVDNIDLAILEEKLGIKIRID